MEHIIIEQSDSADPNSKNTRKKTKYDAKEYNLHSTSISISLLKEHIIIEQSDLHVKEITFLYFR